MNRATPVVGFVAVAVAVAVAGCGAQAVAPNGSAAAASPTRSPSGLTPATSTSPTSNPIRLVIRTTRWRLPTPVAREAVVVTPDGLVVAGGLVAGDQSTATSYRIDPTTGHVQPLPDLPIPVHDTAGVLLGGRPVVVGGGNAAEQDVVQVRGAAGWSVTGHLPQARSDLTAVTVSGRALVFGGYDAKTPAVPTVLASQDGISWSSIGTLPVPVRYAAGVVRSHQVWLFGGERSGVEQRSVQRVDPATGHARVVAQLPMPLGHASAISLGHRILLVGGRTDPSTPTRRMWWFDPATRKFTPAGRLPFPLADSAVVVVGPVAYLVGGESPLVTDRVLRVTLR